VNNLLIELWKELQQSKYAPVLALGFLHLRIAREVLVIEGDIDLMDSENSVTEMFRRQT
jgi:hypothetical protein